MASSARESILQAAGNLFFQHGYRAIGIDTIIAESGVAKATLYRHFPSKDALIVAYLEEMNRQFWLWFDAAAQNAADPRGQLLAVFAALQELVSTPTCYGCPFLIAATEFPERDHPGHQIALANKQAVRARFAALCAQAGYAQPQMLADQLFLLMDAAFVAVRTYGVDNPARQVHAFAETLLRCAA